MGRFILALFFVFFIGKGVFAQHTKVGKELITFTGEDITLYQRCKENQQLDGVDCVQIKNQVNTEMSTRLDCQSTDCLTIAIITSGCNYGVCDEFAFKLLGSSPYEIKIREYNQFGKLIAFYGKRNINKANKIKRTEKYSIEESAYIEISQKGSSMIRLVNLHGPLAGVGINTSKPFQKY